MTATAPALEPASDPAVRSTGIGGSDVPIILGLSPYSSPFDLWARKVGMAPEQRWNRAMTWGTTLERTVAKHYAKTMPAVVRRHRSTIRMPGKPWLLAHVDGFATVELSGEHEHLTSGRIVLEVKTGSAFDATWERTADGLPIHVLLQVLHYMAVTGLRHADVAALIGGSDYRVYHVEWDQELWDKVEPKLTEFWRRVVEKDAPPLDGSDSTAELLKALYPQGDPDVVITLDEDAIKGMTTVEERMAAKDAIAAIRDLRLARINVKAAETRKAELEATIKAYMGPATLLELEDGAKVTWRNDKDSEEVNWPGIAIGYRRVLEAVKTLTGITADEVERNTPGAGAILSNPDTWEKIHTNPKAGSRRFLPTFPKEDADANATR